MSKTDKELLELAAKAAGLSKKQLSIEAEALAYAGKSDECWNPLADDGDALRLAVKIGAIVDIKIIEGVVIVWPDVVELFSGDIYAATRRAIVRAAAEVGGKL